MASWHFVVRSFAVIPTADSNSELLLQLCGLRDDYYHLDVVGAGDDGPSGNTEAGTG